MDFNSATASVALGKIKVHTPCLFKLFNVSNQSGIFWHPVADNYAYLFDKAMAIPRPFRVS